MSAEEGVTVKVNATPSEQAVKMRGLIEATETLPDGKIVKLKRPSALVQFRFIKLIGGNNDRYVDALSPFVYIESIDGDRVDLTTERQIDALINRLEEEGINAIGAAVLKHFGKPDPAKDLADLKK